MRISHSQCWSGPFLQWINNYSPHIHIFTTIIHHNYSPQLFTTIIHHNYSPQLFTTYSHIHHNYSPHIHIFTTIIHHIFTYSPQLFTTIIHHITMIHHIFTIFHHHFVFNGRIPGGSSLGGSCRHEPHEALSDGEAEQRLDRRAHLCGCRTGVAPWLRGSVGVAPLRNGGTPMVGGFL